MNIKELRKKINKVDDKISSLFIERMKLASDIGLCKFENGLNIRDPKREKEITNRLMKSCGDIYAPYINALYSQIFEMTRRYESHLQVVSSIEYGLIGPEVSNSYLKWLHHSMGIKNFGLYNLPKDMLPLLFEKRAFKGLCIQSAYKPLVPAYCSALDGISSKTGYVNTVIKNEAGELCGYNTEYDAFTAASKKAGFDYRGKKIMVLGNGSFSKSIQEALKDGGASEILIVERTGEINFRNYKKFSHADILINATNIGMEPDSEIKPVDISAFPNLSGIVESVYTPVETLLLSDAKKRGLPYIDGLSMAIEQCMKSSELFGIRPDKEIGSQLYEELLTFIE